jgi:hypothetical protein
MFDKSYGDGGKNKIKRKRTPKKEGFSKTAKRFSKSAFKRCTFLKKSAIIQE